MLCMSRCTDDVWSRSRGASAPDSSIRKREAAAGSCFAVFFRCRLLVADHPFFCFSFPFRPVLTPTHPTASGHWISFFPNRTAEHGHSTVSTISASSTGSLFTRLTWPLLAGRYSSPVLLFPLMTLDLVTAVHTLRLVTRSDNLFSLLTLRLYCRL